MRNHALLYLLRPDGEAGEFEPLGESNSALPALWRILFASSVPLRTVDVERVFERSVQHSIAADANAALDRVRRVTRWLLGQPHMLGCTAVPRYLEAVDQYLAERIAHWTIATDAPPTFVIAFDEFSMTPSLAQQACEQWWQAFVAVESGADASLLERLLALVSTRNRLDEWRTWSETFGFALFEHAYFATAFRQPHSGLYESATAAAVCAERTRWPLVHGFAVVLEEDRYGYVDAQGRVLVEPQFDLADDFTAAGVARVCKQRRYGLLRADGAYAVPLQYDDVEWCAELDGWLCRRQDEYTLLRPDGSAWLNASWHAIDALVPQRWLRVRRGDAVGVLHWSGEIALPCQYSRVETFEPRVARGVATELRDCLRVTSLPGRARPKVGVWDLNRAASIVCCAYDFVWLVRLAADRHGFLVANKLPYEYGTRTARYRVGVLDADGRELVPLEYAWLGVRADLSKTGAGERVCESLHWAWSRDEMAAAELPNGDRVLITSDGRAVAGEVATLRPPELPSPPMSESIAAAFYKFVTLADYRELREPLLARCEALEIRGTILLAEEGINGTIAGARDNVRALLAHLRSDARLAELEHKESPASGTPFYRMKVRLKREIVTLGVPQVNAATMAGTYVKPEDWNALIDDPDVVVIDARNDYEVALGTFQGAINPKTRSFRELPAWLRSQERLKNKPKVAMFCTGGIRCEKSTAFLRSEGFDEVYHLQGGILKYLESIPAEQSRWQGECFVFDERVGLGHGLQPGAHELCRSCREPVGAAEKASEFYIAGVSCPKCYHQRSEEKKRGLQERQRQMELAKQRNDSHIGVRQELKKKLRR